VKKLFEHLLLDNKCRGSYHDSLIEVELFNLVFPDFLRDHPRDVLSNFIIAKFEILREEILAIFYDEDLVLLVVTLRGMKILLGCTLERLADLSVLGDVHGGLERYFRSIDRTIKGDLFKFLLESIHLFNLRVKGQLHTSHLQTFQGVQLILKALIWTAEKGISRTAHRKTCAKAPGNGCLL
jgi:hypothetical protein